jgi:hypothetical protein
MSQMTKAVQQTHTIFADGVLACAAVAAATAQRAQTFTLALLYLKRRAMKGARYIFRTTAAQISRRLKVFKTHFRTHLIVLHIQKHKRYPW